MALNWEETRDILRELESVYQSEDSDLVASIAAQAAQIAAILAQSEVDVKKSIRELAKQVYGEEEGDEENRDRLSGGPLAAQAAHNEAVGALRRRCGAAELEVGSLKEAQRGMEAQLAAVLAEDRRTAQEAAAVQEARKVDIPRVKHSISLYTNISNIRWDTESKNVSGCILPPDGGPMKAFDFDPSRATDYQIANALWDMIGVATSSS